MPGFDFSNHNRNAALHAQGVPLPKATSTGTTIVGCLFDGGVVIAADTRATSGPIVADKASQTQTAQLGITYNEPGSSKILTVPHRIARNFITLPLKFGVREQVPLRIPNSPPPSSPPTLSYTPSPQAENLV